ncbi:MAG: hypothetical protein GWO84_01120 [Euryarchaeota archaeon]|nr:hypothetical protein [Euryarchaeota archaeon]
MSEEEMDEVVEELNEEVASTDKTSAENSDDIKQKKLAAKFRTIEGEEILLTKQPSAFAFIGMYILGLIVLGVHLLFDHHDAVMGDASGLAKFIIAIITMGENSVPFGFVFVMLTVAWINRMMNMSTSSGWVTTWLLLATFAPIILKIDKLLEWVTGIFMDDSIGGFLPDVYDYTIFGIIFVSMFWGLTYYYQKSFNYAVTSDAVIFQHRFLLSHSRRRILYDRISEVMEDRKPLGVLLGFSTITILTDTGVGMAEETIGIGAGATLPGTGESDSDSPATAAGKSWIRSIVGLLSYQRTVTKVMADPKNCFYSIRNYEKTKMLVDEMHKKHSSSSLLSDLKDSLTQPKAE